MRRWAVLFTGILAAGFVGAACGTPQQIGSGTDGHDKVFVCKYTGTPGVDERLQGGGNPISVDYQPGREPGKFFNDAQGRSYSLEYDIGQPEPPVSDCPPPDTGGTTTTTQKATTTTEEEATTTTCADCVPNTNAATTTTTEVPPSTSTTTTVAVTTSTAPAVTTSTTSTTAAPTTTVPGTPPITGPADAPFTFGAAATVCVREVPTIRIVFQNRFPELAGQTGTLTMQDVNGNVVSTQPLVYRPGTTVDLLYPGTSVNPDGSIDDVPGWILTDDGLWVRDPSDDYLRDGIRLVYEVNPTATAFVTYPPESSTCANPDGPFPPTATVSTAPPATAPPEGLPPTR